MVIACCQKWKIGLCSVSLMAALSGPGALAALADTTAAAPTADAQQQKQRVSGTVTDTSGEPVVGAVVQEIGTSNATITGADGSYVLEVNPNAILEVSSLGHIKQTTAVENRSNVSFQMQADAQSLEEIVVTGFGFTQKRATLTGAISTIGANDIERSSASTVSGALVGKIAGVNTRQTDGRPGSGARRSVSATWAPRYM